MTFSCTWCNFFTSLKFFPCHISAVGIHPTHYSTWCALSLHRMWMKSTIRSLVHSPRSNSLLNLITIDSAYPFLIALPLQPSSLSHWSTVWIVATSFQWACPVKPQRRLEARPVRTPYHKFQQILIILSGVTRPRTFPTEFQRLRGSCMCIGPVPCLRLARNPEKSSRSR